MGVVNRVFVKGIVLVLAASLLVACGGKEERKAKYMERGKAYFAEKNYDKAKIEFLNVLQIDAKTAEAFVYTAEINEKEQDWAKAFANFKKAIKLDPELTKPRVHLARMYLLQAAAMRSQDKPDAVANAMGLAQEQIAEVLAKDPENAEGLTLQASMWVSEGDTDKAIQQLETVNSREPGLTSAAGLLSALYAQKGRPDDAEAVLVKAIDNSDDPLATQIRLMQFYRSQEKNDQAEEVLRTVIRDNPDELNYRVTLAALLAQTGKKDEAEQVLRDAIADDPEDAQRYLLLVQFFAGQKDSETAIETLKGFIEEHPDMTDLQFGLVKLYLDEENKDTAKQTLERLISEQGTEPAGLRARVLLAQMIVIEEPESPRVASLVEEVLAENPRDNDALLLKGRLAARAEDYATAINSFRSVLKDQPNSDEVLMLLATAHFANGEKELGKDMLNRAIDANPDKLRAHLMMARVLAGEKDIDGALAQVDEVLKRDQYNEKALVMKYELLAMKKDAEGMAAVTKIMQEGAPEKEAGYLREAQLRFAQKDYDAALVITDKVLEQNPDSVGALRVKSDTLAAQKNYDEAIAVVDHIIELYPDSAEGYYRKGKLLALKDEPAAALAQYELSLQKAPDSSDALKEVVLLEVRVKGADTAEKRLQALLQEKPDHPEANRLLAMVYTATGDHDAAEQSLRKQLEISPDSNTYSELARILILKKDLAGAAQVYEEGLKAHPDDVALLVGLASVREQQEDFDTAISLFEKVLEIQPANAVSTNNLAALLSDHRSDQASLDRAVEMAGILEKTNQPAFLDTAGWIYYRAGDYDKALDILSKVVEKLPKVPVFQYHLGMTYFKMSDKDAARKHLTNATVEGADYTGIEEARETLKGL